MPLRSPHRGFTLIEVLVALAIFAVALAASVRAASMSTDGTYEIRERMFATWVAQNRLAELSARGEFPNVGDRRDEAMQGNQRFLIEEVVSGTQDANFRRVEVRVASERRPDYVLSRLVGHAFRSR